MKITRNGLEMSIKNMFYNIKIKQQGEKTGVWNGFSIPYYIYTRAREVKEGIRMGCFFLPTGKNVFPNGGEIIRREGRKI